MFNLFCIVFLALCLVIRFWPARKPKPDMANPPYLVERRRQEAWERADQGRREKLRRDYPHLYRQTKKDD